MIRCDICGNRFRNARALAAHSRFHQDPVEFDSVKTDEPIRVECGYCQKTVEAIFLLDGSGDWICGTCHGTGSIRVNLSGPPQIIGEDTP